jgi:hypothetical protein
MWKTASGDWSLTPVHKAHQWTPFQVAYSSHIYFCQAVVLTLEQHQTLIDLCRSLRTICPGATMGGLMYLPGTLMRATQAQPSHAVLHQPETRTWPQSEDSCVDQIPREPTKLYLCPRQTKDSSRASTLFGRCICIATRAHIASRQSQDFYGSVSTAQQ